MASHLEEPLASKRRHSLCMFLSQLSARHVYSALAGLRLMVQISAAITPPGFTHSMSSYCLSPNFLPPSTTAYMNYTLHYTTPASTHFHARLKGERAGGGGTSKGSMVGVVVLTRMLLEQLGALDEDAVIPYLRRELEWVVENVRYIPSDLDPRRVLTNELWRRTTDRGWTWPA